MGNDNIMCCIIIEEKHAAENVDEIAQTPGIDLLFIGTSDLSFSITGDKTKVMTPPVKSAMEKVLAAGRKYGIPVGCPAEWSLSGTHLVARLLLCPAKSGAFIAGAWKLPPGLLFSDSLSPS